MEILFIYMYFPFLLFISMFINYSGASTTDMRGTEDNSKIIFLFLNENIYSDLSFRTVSMKCERVLMMLSLKNIEKYP